MKKLTVLLISICIFSCSKIDDRQSSNINVNPGKYDYANVLDVFDIKGIIKLQKVSDSHIGEATKVVIHNGFIYVLDFRLAKSLFIFNRDGDFIDKIQGIQHLDPFEPFQISDFTINRETGDIALADNIQKRVFIYNKNGKIQKHIYKLKTSPNKIIWSDNSRYFFKTNSEVHTEVPLFFGIDFRKDSIVEFPILFPQHQIDGVPYAEKYCFSRFEDNALIYNYKTDTVYCFNDALIPRFIINYGKYSPPLEFWNHLEKGRSYIHKLGQSQFAYRKDFILENNDMILFPFVKNGETFHCFHVKKDSSNHVLRIGDFNNIYGRIRPVGIIDEGIVLSYDALKLMEMYQQSESSDENCFERLFSFDQSFKTTLQTMEANDNPVLFLLKPKIVFDKR